MREIKILLLSFIVLNSLHPCADVEVKIHPSDIQRPESVAESHEEVDLGEAKDDSQVSRSIDYYYAERAKGE